MSTPTVTAVPQDESKKSLGSKIKQHKLAVGMAAVTLLSAGYALWPASTKGEPPAVSKTEQTAVSKPAEIMSDTTSVGEQKTVSFRVAGTGSTASGSLVFLNDKSNYRDADTLTVVCGPGVKKVRDANNGRHRKDLLGKQITVKGEIGEYGGKRQLKVESDSDITIK